MRIGDAKRGVSPWKTANNQCIISRSLTVHTWKLHYLDNFMIPSHGAMAQIAKTRWFSAANYLNRARAPPPLLPFRFLRRRRAANSPEAPARLPAC